METSNYPTYKDTSLHIGIKENSLKYILIKNIQVNSTITIQTCYGYDIGSVIRHIHYTLDENHLSIPVVSAPVMRDCDNSPTQDRNTKILRILTNHKIMRNED